MFNTPVTAIAMITIFLNMRVALSTNFCLVYFVILLNFYHYIVNRILTGQIAVIKTNQN